MFIALAILAKVALTDRLIMVAQLLGGVAAIAGILTFLWVRLRLDRAWAWLTRHMKEDARTARQAELVEVLSGPTISGMIETRLVETIDEKVVPEISKINVRIDEHMIREEETMKRDADSIATIATHMENISGKLDAELKRVAEDRPLWLVDRERISRLENRVDGIHGQAV